MSAASYAAVVVSDLAVSVPWYVQALGCEEVERGAGWVCLAFDDGSRIELFAGDPRRPGTALPSYGRDTGPPVLPGLGVTEPAEAARDLRVVRRLPGWYVVVAPGGVRIVLTDLEGVAGRGLVGFRWRVPDAEALTRFLRTLGCDDPVEVGEPAVIPRVAGWHVGTLADPDGTLVECTDRPT